MARGGGGCKISWAPTHTRVATRGEIDRIEGGGGSGCLHAASRTHGREAREGLREVAQPVQRVDVGRVAVLHQALGVQPHLVAAPDAVVSSSSSSSASASASTCNCHSLGTAR
jgi:hypothetical protein